MSDFSLNNFDFNLPEERIALFPNINRDESNLLIVNNNSENFEIKKFYDIADYLNEGDVIVINDSKVINARLFAKNANSKNFEVLLNRPVEENTFETLIRNSKKLKVGNILVFSENLTAKVLKKQEDGIVLLHFLFNKNINLIDEINKLGQIPLPPYILKKRKLMPSDLQDYQSIFAKNYGSVASSTASLHFSNKVIDKILKKGVNIIYITLHIGLGTFKPISEKEIKEKKLHTEIYSISKQSADIINYAKRSGRKIIAVGTSVLRALESSAGDKDVIEKNLNTTNIFIMPGFKFKVVDKLITNFHLPKSSLFMLVCAFLNDANKMKRAYNFAIDNNFMFYSYGDACLLER